MDLRIVFMGTPDFAVPSLRILVENGYNVVGVITATDKLGGRGKKQLLQSPVKKYAVEQNIPVLQPRNLKSKSFLQELRALNANLQIIVAFRMLPVVVWDMPELGTFNLHGSLLPKYRGAAPINWAVIRGEKETGVTTFFLQHEIDTGDIIMQESMPINENDTAGDVHDRMMELGSEVVLKTVQAVESKSVVSKKQDDTEATSAPKIFTETCEINFDRDTQTVHNFVRGLSPYPAAWTMLDGKILKILKASPIVEDHDHPAGHFFSDNKNWIKVSTNDGFLNIHQLQLQGRKRMDTKAFLNGYNFD
ncbi:MAG: methionyl-tRNA formyltransferase [Bacteroidota bacterium]